MKNRILSGFRDLSFTVGFHGATMDELSFQTGISKRTIYRYFKSKDELVNAVVDDLMALTEQHVNTVLASEGNPVEKIATLISTVFQNLKFLNPLIMRDIQKYYPHIWSRIEAFRARKIRSVIENMLLAETQQGYLRETIPAVFMTALLSSIRDVVNPAFILENGLT
ncbi:MAG: TetR/AcrR family transcriptional regulator [Firmicutes bacterium]|nr:TetR/AcrR family transcriptional regulator [Bacillota bacterium]